MANHGGKREGSGAKRPMSPFGEKTSVIRVPTSIKEDVQRYLEAFKTNVKGQSANPSVNLPQAASNPIDIALPIYSGKVSAGRPRFPSPAQDYEPEELDLNKRFITNPPATFFFTVSGDSMIDVGIFPNSTLIVDRAIKAKSSSIVLAMVDGELVVKRLYKRGNVVKLMSENPAYAPIEFSEGQELIIWGVVTYVISQPI